MASPLAARVLASLDWVTLVRPLFHYESMSTNILLLSEQPELLHGYIQQPKHLQGLRCRVLLILPYVYPPLLFELRPTLNDVLRHQLPERVRLRIR